jgi:hypothetical protein
MKKLLYILIISTSFFSNSQTQSDIELLNAFGINPNDINSGADFKITTLTVKLQNLIDEKKARSIIFARWNDMLNYYQPNSNNLKGDITNFNNPPVDELNKYQTLSADNLGIQYMGKQIIIYIPRGIGITDGFKGTKYNSEQCRTDLITYLRASFQYQIDGSNDKNINNSTVRNNIRGCYNAGKFDKIEPVLPEDLQIEISDEDNPFKGFRGFGTDLDINEIQKLLMGGTSKLPKVGPNGKNPYLPFSIDARKGMR